MPGSHMDVPGEREEIEERTPPEIKTGRKTGTSMGEDKSTSELMDELKGAESFGQYAAENGKAFLHARSEGGSACPFCGKRLPENASYCTHCMRVLNGRRVLFEEKKKVRSLRRIFLCVSGGLFAAFAIFFAIRHEKGQKTSVFLPSPDEFRAYAYGAMKEADEEERMLWAPETLVKTKEQDGLIVYEGETSLSDTPVLTAFSHDGKRLYFAVFDIPHEYSESALKAVKTAFSAVYRRVPENLEDLLLQDGAFQKPDLPDEALDAFLAAAKTEAPFGMTEVSLPIRAEMHEGGPGARVYRINGEGTLDLIVLFESEAS